MPPKPFQCSDGMCGADDCKRCHPENFKDGVYISPEEDIMEAHARLDREGCQTFTP